MKKCIYASVERFDATVNVPAPNGRFVRHSDYRALQVEVRQLRRVALRMLADMPAEQRQKYIGSGNE